ncbi:MAG: molybdenum cofactor guanylyltransferase, partial [Tissierellia bacterium]|nr:molybdenum cofactor guanylyltransferase [Tissierellia bacterium]
YSKDMIKDIEKHLLKDRKSVNSLIGKLPVCYIEEEEARRFSPNWDMFLNLNTKEELNDYLRSINSQD